MKRHVMGPRDQRFDKLIAAKQKKFEAVMVWKFDRFARSTSHLLSSLEKFRSLGIAFVSVQDNVDTTTAMGECIVTIQHCHSSNGR